MTNIDLDADLMRQAADLLAERAEKRARALDEAMDASLDMIRILRRQALKAEAEDRPLPEGTDLAFHRVSRDLRLTCALQARFDLPLEERVRAAAEQAEASRRASEALARRKGSVAAARRFTTGLIVEKMVETESRESEREREDEIELLARMDGRLNAITDEEALTTPVGVLAERVLAGLGIAPRWELFEDEELETLGVVIPGGRDDDSLEDHLARGLAEDEAPP